MEEKTRNTTPMQIAKTGYVVISVALCALGLIMIILPDFSITLAGTLLGVMMIVFGAVKIIGYWSKDLYRLAFQYDFAFGILMVPLGMFILFHPSEAVSFFYIILGVVILADGMFKLQMALDARAFGLERWQLIFVLAILAGVIGCVLIFHPSDSAEVATALVGTALLGEGLLNLIVALFAVKIVSYQRMDEY